eukprot:TRINITY_DN2099_c0_g1_i1.p1 TRINITY_DN2099_c0_g1~~TRINITY_DN2099_c0_g1_i1.p1  ORF type:complete len:829 (-),score=249.56 TRINITY_DN2099_c0_g1_i1:274-2760(-)
MAEAAPEAKQLVVGIDLGAADSYVGYIDRGAVDIAQNEISQRKTPTLAGFNERERLLGDSALSLIKSNVKNTCRNFKHLLGQRLDSPGLEIEQFWSAAPLVADEEGLAAFDVNYRGERKSFSTVAVTAMFLTKLKDVAESWCRGSEVADGVIAVPAYFTDVQRTALLDAAKVAGINVVRVMNEHTAVALNYGYYRFHDCEASKTSTVVFCSMGHTVFSVSLVQFTRGKMTILCEKSAKVGGRDMDECLMRSFAKQFQQKVGSDPLSNKKAFIKLEDAVAKTKKILSANSEASIGVECLMEDEDFSSHIDRAKFLEMCEPMMQKVSDVLDAVKAMAGPALDTIEAVEMVGGASRVPWVKEMCSKAFKGMELSSTLNADECVARGCTLQAALLSPLYKAREFRVEDTSAFPVVLGWQFPAPAPPAGENGAEGAPPAKPAAALERSALLFPENSLTNVYKVVTFFRRETFQLKAMYGSDAVLPPGTARELGTYEVELPPLPEPRKVKVRTSLTLHGTFKVEGATLVEEEEKEEEKEPSTDKKPEKEGEERPAGATGPKEASGEAPAASPEGGANATAGVKREASSDEVAMPRKRLKRTPLVVKASGQPGLSAAAVDRRRDEELAMREQMREVVETGARRNDLESYILGMRSGIAEGGKYGKFVVPAVRDEFSAQLAKAEEWLYDHLEEEKSVFIEKLAELRKLGDPVERRYREAGTRAELAADLLENCKSHKAYAKELKGKPLPPGVDTLSVQRLEVACDACERWLADLQAQQDKVASHEDPVLKAADMQAKAEELKGLAQALQSGDGDVTMTPVGSPIAPMSPPPPSPSR